MDPLQVNLKTLYFTNFDIKTTSICLIKIDYLLTRLLFKAKREKEDDWFKVHFNETLTDTVQLSIKVGLNETVNNKTKTVK